MEPIKRQGAIIALIASSTMACSGVAAEGPASSPQEVEVKGLKSAAAFVHISDDKARAQALFTEAGKVLQHARCMNCHPSTDRPLQTDAQHPHQPPVVRGEDGHGAVGMQCATCHHAENVDLGTHSVPGHHAWHLAPASMGWVGQSLDAICEQVKDPTRNGNRDLEAIIEHMAEDGLVGWAWSPGPGREPAPGTQSVFGGLVKAWAAAGAHCPAPGATVARK